MNQIKICASIASARCDKEGAWKIVLDVPSSDAVKVAQLTALVETELVVTFSAAG